MIEKQSNVFFTKALTQYLKFVFQPKKGEGGGDKISLIILFHFLKINFSPKSIISKCKEIFQIIYKYLAQQQKRKRNKLLANFLSIFVIRKLMLLQTSQSMQKIFQRNKQIFCQAKNLFMKKKYEQALVKLIRLYKKDNLELKWESCNIIAQCYEHLQDWESCALWLQRFQEVNLKIQLEKIILAKRVSRVHLENKTMLKVGQIEAVLQLAFIYVLQNRIEQAVTNLKNFYFEEPLERKVLIKLCELLQRTGRTSQVLNYNWKLIRLFPSQGEHYLRHAYNLRKLNRLKQAQNVLCKGKELSDQKFKAIFNFQLGCVSKDMGQGRNSLFAFDNALKDDQHFQKAFYQRVKMFLYLQIDQTFQGFVIDPKNHFCQFSIITHLSTKNYGFYDKNKISILSSLPNTELAFEIAFMSYSRFQCQGLKEYFKKNSITYEKKNTRKKFALYYLASCLELLQQYESALVCFQSISKELEQSEFQYSLELKIALNLARINRKKQSLLFLTNLSRKLQDFSYLECKLINRFRQLYYLLGYYRDCVSNYQQECILGIQFNLQQYLWIILSFTCMEQLQKAKGAFVDCFLGLRRFEHKSFLTNQFNEIINWGAKYGFVGFACQLLKIGYQAISKSEGIYGVKYLQKIKGKFDKSKKILLQKKGN